VFLKLHLEELKASLQQNFHLQQLRMPEVECRAKKKPHFYVHLRSHLKENSRFSSAKHFGSQTVISLLPMQSHHDSSDANKIIPDLYSCVQD